MAVEEEGGWTQFERPTSFAVVGLGGAGSEAVRDLIGLEIPGVRTFAINTDAGHLQRMPIDQRVLIGHGTFRGRGSGGDRGAVLRAAQESREEILRQLRAHEVVFLLAALGGGTGSALLPYLVRELRNSGILPIPVAFLPFHVEVATNPSRRHSVGDTLRELEELGGLLLLLANEKLRRFDHLPLHRALGVRNAYLHGLVTSLVDMVENPSQMNVDLATMRRHLEGAGLTTLVCGQAHVSEAESLAAEAIRDSLLDFELEPRTRALIHIEGGSNLTLGAFDRILTSTRGHLGNPEELVFGTRLLPEPRETVRLTGLVSGIRVGSIQRLLDTPSAPPGPLAAG
ncbi:MAG: hypothetical protein ACREBT_06270 [Thermoplasmata archaeon]